MDFLLTVLRLIHIISAVIWVGLAAAMTLYILPAATAAGENGLRYMKSLLTNTRFAITIPIVSGLTILAGLLLLAIGSMSHFSSNGRMVLGLGALFGIIGGIYSGAVARRASRTFAEMLVK